MLVGGRMRTLADLYDLKQAENIMFDNAYQFLIAQLKNDFLKLNGLERVKCNLSDWQEEAQIEILSQMIKDLRQQGICDEDIKDLKGIIPERKSKIELYLDESGHSGNVLLNKHDQLYRKNQAQFVLGCVIVKNSLDRDILIQRYKEFKVRWEVSEELKSTELLEENNSAMLKDFIENLLDDEHYFICVYDKKYYLSSAIAFYLFGKKMQLDQPLWFYKNVSALAREDESILRKYCIAVKQPNDANIEAFLRYIQDFTYTKLDSKQNFFKAAAEKMLRNKSISGLQAPLLSAGQYIKKNNANVISMNALGESVLSICYNEGINAKDLMVYHDQIDQYNEEFNSIAEFTVEFLDSKSNELIQLADNVAGIFRRSFSETIDIFKTNVQWQEVKTSRFPQMLSSIVEQVTDYNIKYDVPIADWALALTVEKMFSSGYPVDSRNHSNFCSEFMEARRIVETNCANMDVSYKF